MKNIYYCLLIILFLVGNNKYNCLNEVILFDICDSSRLMNYYQNGLVERRVHKFRVMALVISRVSRLHYFGGAKIETEAGEIRAFVC